jgi:hypothetical protein
MLVEQDQRACVLEAVGLGVNEFLLKPVSITALRNASHPSWRSLSL